MPSSESVPLDSQDREILDYAQQLCRQLGYKRKILDVTWTDRIDFYRTPPDYVLIYRNELILPKNLMGKLNTEDWKPLVASAVIHRSTINKKTVRGLAKTLLPAFLVMYFGVFTVEHILTGNSLTSSLVANASFATGIGLVVYALARMFRQFKRFYLEADEEASRLFGIDAVVSALEKMRSIGVARVAPARDQPRIQERISNLLKASPAHGPSRD
jgi:hypothetical protein